jgi:hypothetical protein
VDAVQFLGAAGGIGALDIEFVKITPETEVDSLEPFLAAGARLGAKYAIASPSRFGPIGGPDDRNQRSGLALWIARSAGILPLDGGPRSPPPRWP